MSHRETIQELRRLMCEARLIARPDPAAPAPSLADLQRAAICGLLLNGEWERASCAIARLAHRQRRSDERAFTALTGRIGPFLGAPRE